MKHACLILFVSVFLLITGTVYSDANNNNEEIAETRRGIPVGVSGLSYGERAMERLVEQVLGTDEKASPERLEDYLYRLKTRMITEPNFMAYQVEGQFITQTTDENDSEGKEDVLLLEGHAAHPYHQDLPGIVFERMGFNVQNNIQLLPDKETLKEELFAAQISPTAYVYEKPDANSEVVTQGLYGNYYFLLKKNGNYYYVHSDEGYLGYIHEREIIKFDEKMFTQYLNSPKVFLIESIQVSDLKLSAGSVIQYLGSNSGTFQVRLLDESELSIPTKVGLAPLDAAENKINKMIEFAQTYLGTGYDWGGKSCEGLDCSGFTQMIYRSIGIQLPRDSYQQFLVGKLVATPWYNASLKSGDTLFFISHNTGRIVHVAVSLGEYEYIHAEVPVVSTNSFDPDHEDFSANRLQSFFYGKRPYAR